MLNNKKGSLNDSLTVTDVLSYEFFFLISFLIKEKLSVTINSFLLSTYGVRISLEYCMQLIGVMEDRITPWNEQSKEMVAQSRLVYLRVTAEELRLCISVS